MQRLRLSSAVASSQHNVDELSLGKKPEGLRQRWEGIRPRAGRRPGRRAGSSFPGAAEAASTYTSRQGGPSGRVTQKRKYAEEEKR